MTTVLKQSDPQQEVLPPFPVRRWSLEEYHALIDQGMFDEERVELLEGWIVPKRTKNPRHEATVFRVSAVLGRLITDKLSIRQQSAISLETSEPEPDLSVVNGDGSLYCERHPHAEDVRLVIEIADSSLRRDRRKAAIHAGAGIPEYWIVNLEEQVVEIFRLPSDDEQKYRESAIRRPGDQIEVTFAEDAVAIEVSSLFPRPVIQH